VPSLPVHTDIAHLPGWGQFHSPSGSELSDSTTSPLQALAPNAAIAKPNRARTQPPFFIERTSRNLVLLALNDARKTSVVEHPARRSLVDITLDAQPGWDVT